MTLVVTAVAMAAGVIDSFLSGKSARSKPRACPQFNR